MPLDGLPSLSVPLLVTGGDLRLELARIRYDICDNIISSRSIFVASGGQESLWVLEGSKNEQNRAWNNRNGSQSVITMSWQCQTANYPLSYSRAPRALSWRPWVICEFCCHALKNLLYGSATASYLNRTWTLPGNFQPVLAAMDSIFLIYGYGTANWDKLTVNPTHLRQLVFVMTVHHYPIINQRVRFRASPCEKKPLIPQLCHSGINQICAMIYVKESAVPSWA